MMAVYVKHLLPPPIQRDEVMRYSGMRETDDTVSALAEKCIDEVLPLLQYHVCYTEVPITVSDDRVDFGFAAVNSAALADRLKDVDRAVIFAATIGMAIDRHIAKFARVSPAKAVLLQAFGAERIESLCDAFCEELAAQYGGVTMRFSPGYGDLPLDFQKELFSLLDCPRKIGLTLNDSLLMSPSKSVTAIVGVGNTATACGKHSCETCTNTQCSYRVSTK